jgi:hypothetical protein
MHITDHLIQINRLKFLNIRSAVTNLLRKYRRTERIWRLIRRVTERLWTKPHLTVQGQAACSARGAISKDQGNVIILNCILISMINNFSSNHYAALEMNNVTHLSKVYVTALWTHVRAGGRDYQKTLLHSVKPLRYGLLANRSHLLDQRNFQHAAVAIYKAQDDNSAHLFG